MTSFVPQIDPAGKLVVEFEREPKKRPLPPWHLSHLAATPVFKFPITNPKSLPAAKRVPTRFLRSDR